MLLIWGLFVYPSLFVLRYPVANSLLYKSLNLPSCSVLWPEGLMTGLPSYCCMGLNLPVGDFASCREELDLLSVVGPRLSRLGVA